MNENFTLPVEKGLCKDCKWRFERVFIPTRPEEFEDDEGNKLLEGYDGESDTVIINLCILSELDLDADITIKCNNYEKKGDDEEEDVVSLFRHDIK